MAAPAASAASVRSSTEQRGEQTTVVAPCRIGLGGSFGERRQVELGHATMEQLHVRQLVLAGAVHDRRHEVRQHGVGALPPDPVEQLERLLCVDRAVPVRQQVIADDVGEPRSQLVGRRTRRRSLRAAPPGPARVAPSRPNRRNSARGSTGRLAIGSGSGCTGRSRSLLGDAGDRLHDRQRAIVAFVVIDHRQAVGQRGDRSGPTRTRPVALRRRPPPRSARRDSRRRAAAARRRATPGRCSRARSHGAGSPAAAAAARSGRDRDSSTASVPSAPMSTRCVRTSSSPSTQRPSLTRNFQLCHAHVSRSPSSSPVVRP